MTPSHYQRKIYYFVEAGRGDGIVSAVAGSGKTTTIVAAANLVRSSNVLFLAFNKAIVQELRRRLGSHVTCRTLNALGHATIQRHLERKLDVEDRKYDRIVSTMLERRFGWLRGAPRSETKRAVLEVVSFAQSSLVDPEDTMGMHRLCAHFGIELPDTPAPTSSEIYALACAAMLEGEELARADGIVDYDDQIWLCHRWDLSPPAADFVFVDEAQDLSPAKRELALSARAPGGRMLFVGDPRQSIYGFAGADVNSFAEIQRVTSATPLALSVCYRCPTSHLDLARKIVPEIEPGPSAIAGSVWPIPRNALANVVRNGDLVLCRLTAPLIETCLDLISKKVPARVKGRDLARQLVTTARAALGDMPWEDFGDALELYQEAKFARLSKDPNGEKKIQALRDQCKGLRALYEAFTSATSLEDFKRDVEAIFSDDAAVVELSTVHRAKGLEADRVFLIDPEGMPMVWAGQQPWEYTQEMNLRYVALTRARAELFFVGAAA